MIQKIFIAPGCLPPQPIASEIRSRPGTISALVLVRVKEIFLYILGCKSDFHETLIAPSNFRSCFLHADRLDFVIVQESLLVQSISNTLANL